MKTKPDTSKLPGDWKSSTQETMPARVRIKITLEVLNSSKTAWLKDGEETQEARITARSYILEGGEGRKVILPRFYPRSGSPRTCWSSFYRSSHHTYELVKG